MANRGQQCFQLLTFRAVESTAATDLVVAVPMHKYRTIDSARLAGKIVIDVMRY